MKVDGFISAHSFSPRVEGGAVIAVTVAAAGSHLVDWEPQKGMLVRHPSLWVGQAPILRVDPFWKHDLLSDPCFLVQSS